jgi:hypothetical protein
VLLQDGREVGFGYVIREGTVSEDNLRRTGGGKRLVPVCNAMREWFNLRSTDLLGQANKQNTGTDSVDRFASNGLGLDGNCEIKPELKKQLE